MSQVPKNILSVLEAENKWKEESLKTIENNPELQDHIRIIDSGINVIGLICLNRKCQDDDEELRARGVRLGNDLTAACNLAFAGYYHVVSMLIRSIEESSYLLFYFEEDRARIQEWRKASLQELRDGYSQKKLRKSFKKRMGKYETDEAQRNSVDVSYQFYCELGTHPSPEDWRLFRKDDTVLLGPFFDPQRLDAYLNELAGKAIIAISALVLAFGKDILKGSILSTDKDFLDRANKWLSKYGNKVQRDDLDSIKKLLRK